MNINPADWPYNFIVSMDQFRANEKNYLRALDEHFGENNDYPYKWAFCGHYTEEQNNIMFLFKDENDAMMARLLWK
jgi:hypothetical protein